MSTSSDTDGLAVSPVTASRFVQPTTRSPDLADGSVAFHAATPPCTVDVAVSTGSDDAIPVNETAAMNPWTTAAENVAVITVPLGSPSGAYADAIAPWLLLSLASEAWTSTDHVRPPPATDASIRVRCAQLRKRTIRDPGAAAAAVFSFIVRVDVFVFPPPSVASTVGPPTGGGVTGSGTVTTAVGCDEAVA